MRTVGLAASTLVALTISATAGSISSDYTKIDFKKDCQTISESEEGASITLQCKGLGSVPIHYAEGDLRAAVTFGDQPEGYDAPWQSFGPWNRINTTVEWRLEDGKPFATILRWFLDNIDPATGSADPKREGNMLVISRVAGLDGKPGCMVGLVDARANTNANELARKVADEMARTLRLPQRQTGISRQARPIRAAAKLGFQAALGFSPRFSSMASAVGSRLRNAL
jgi:hypothetical protein